MIEIYFYKFSIPTDNIMNIIKYMCEKALRYTLTSDYIADL